MVGSPGQGGRKVGAANALGKMAAPAEEEQGEPGQGVRSEPG